MRPQGINLQGGARTSSFLASSVDFKRVDNSPPTRKQEMRRKKPHAPRHVTVNMSLPSNLSPSQRGTAGEDEEELDYNLSAPTARAGGGEDSLIEKYHTKKHKKKSYPCKTLEWNHIMTWINFGLIVILACFVAIYNTHTNAQVVKEMLAGDAPLPQARRAGAKSIPFIITTDIQDTVVKLPRPLEGIQQFDVCCKYKTSIFCSSTQWNRPRPRPVGAGAETKHMFNIYAYLSMEDNSAHIRAIHPDMVGITCSLYLSL